MGQEEKNNIETPAEEQVAPEETPPTADNAVADVPDEIEGEKIKVEEPARKGRETSDAELVERVIKINRVSKVVKGGKNFSFSALVVTGDGNGNVGVGFGKSNEVVEAIKKGVGDSKKNFRKVNMEGDTIPHEVIGEFKASRVILKPAGAGTGVIAGGPVRALCDAVGIKNILTKTLGSRNAINVVKAACDGFDKLRLKRRGQAEEVKSKT